MAAPAKERYPLPPPPDSATVARRTAAAVAGHTGDAPGARAFLADPDAGVRAAALGALIRCKALTDDDLVTSLNDPSPTVRVRAAMAAATRPGVELVTALNDPDPTVVEAAAWAAGERPGASDELSTLIAMATDHADALCREAAVAALGALGDPAGLPAILAATKDKATIRRRAVIALAPFDGPDVDEALANTLTDRDRQVRDIATDLTAPPP